MNVDINACCRGEQPAWNLFVEQTSPIVMAAVRKVMKRSGASAGLLEAEDPFQDVYSRLIRDDFRLLRSYDPARASLSTWLTVIARSVAIDHLRRKRLATVPLDDHQTSRERVRQAHAPHIPLHLLSHRQRLVLRMLFDEEMSVREAAAILGVDEQTVRSTKHKALTRLRAHLSDPPGGEAGGGDDSPPRGVSMEGLTDE